MNMEVAKTQSALNIYDRMENPIQAIEQMGEWFEKSGMFGCDKKGQGAILAMACMLEKKNPITVAATYHLLPGGVSMQSKAQLARFRALGGKVKWKKTTDKECLADFTFEGETTEIGFTFKEAEKMGVVRASGSWQTVPCEMLRARTITRAITMLAPEILIDGGHTEDFGGEAPAPAQAPAPNPLKNAKQAKAETVEEDPDNVVPMDFPSDEKKEEISEKPKRGRGRPRKTDENSSRSEQRAEAREKEAEEKPKGPPMTDSEREAKFRAKEEAAKASETEVVSEDDQKAKAAKAIEAGVEETDKPASTKQIKEIMELVGEHEAGAQAWLTKKGWITDGDIKTLSTKVAARVINNGAAFKRSIKKIKAS